MRYAEKVGKKGNKNVNTTSFEKDKGREREDKECRQIVNGIKKEGEKDKGR